MKQYLNLTRKIVTEGKDIYNERTGKWCRVLINADLSYDVDKGKLPLVTTRKSYAIQAIMEVLGYLRGYNSAEQFRNLGCNTWNANANENKDWLNNPCRNGVDDMGRVYGVQGRHWTNQYGVETDQLVDLYTDLKSGIDSRGEILTFWNPGEFEYGCLRPCMHTHQFSIVNDTLYLNSFQRSCDVLLGLNFNMVQCYFLLAIMAQITGLKPGKAYHKIVNAHIYHDQLEVLLKEGQLDREPFDSPSLWINPRIQNLDDVLTWVSKEDFKVLNYQHHEPIVYPFSI